MRYHVHLYRHAKHLTPLQNILIGTCFSSCITHAHEIWLHVTRAEPVVYFLSVNKEIIGDIATLEKLGSSGNLLEEIRHHAEMATEILFHNL